METNALTAEKINVVRGRRKLLHDVTLELHAGEFMALMGENGAGKSTLLKVCSGETKADSGAVVLAARPLGLWTPLERARMRGVLPQDTQTAFMFTVMDVVLLGRAPHCGGYPGGRDREIAREALQRLDALHLEHRLFPTLSGGERARVSLARVIAQLWEPWNAQPRVLLLDEPIAALDIAHQHLALSAAAALAKEQGFAVLAVLHDLNLAAQYAPRVMLLKGGHTLAAGETESVLTETVLERCFSTRIRRIAHPDNGRLLLVAA